MADAITDTVAPSSVAGASAMRRSSDLGRAANPVGQLADGGVGDLGDERRDAPARHPPERRSPARRGGVGRGGCARVGGRGDGRGADGACSGERARRRRASAASGVRTDVLGHAPALRPAPTPSARTVACPRRIVGTERGGAADLAHDVAEVARAEADGVARAQADAGRA